MEFNPEIAQFVAYTVLTIASVVVAVVSLALLYRQNFGWEPILLLTNPVGITDKSDDGTREWLKIEFEIWNRRKYPISVRSIHVFLKNLRFSDTIDHKISSPRGWSEGAGGLVNTEAIAMEPGGHLAVEVKGLLTTTVDLSRDEILLLSVMYFDPRMNQYKSLRLQEGYLK